MIVHQAIGMAEPIVPKGNTRKGIQEHLSVLIVFENCLSSVSSARTAPGNSIRNGRAMVILNHNINDYATK